MTIQTDSKNIDHRKEEQEPAVTNGTVDNAKEQAHKVEQAPASQVAISAGPPDDLVLLLAPNVDFGDDPFNFQLGIPSGVGVLRWDLSGNTVRPTLTGKIFMNDSKGREAQIWMKYYDVFGTRLATETSASHYPTGSGLQSWAIDFSPYANPAIEKVDVMLVVHYHDNVWWRYASAEYTS